MDTPHRPVRNGVRASLLIAAAALAPALRAETVGMGTVWYDDAAMSGAASSGPNYGFFAPAGNASAVGFTFTAGSSALSNDGTSLSSGQVFLQNMVLVNATSGTATTAFLTVIDTTTNTVVGSSSNSVTLATSATQSAGTPWRFNSLGLDAGKRYAFVFTSTAGVAGTSVSALPSDGGQLAAPLDLDTGAGTLNTVNYRLGGFTNANGSDLIAGAGVFSTASTGFSRNELWFSAGLTTTSQALTTVDGTASDATQASALTLASGMRKIGTGAYTLSSGFANNIQGDIFVEQGTLRVATANGGTTSGVLGSGQVFLINANPAATAVTQNSTTMSGTLLEISTAAGNATLNTAVEGAGNIHVTGANTLTVTSTNSITGRFQVTNGTVSFSDVGNIGVSSQLGRGNSSDGSILLTGGTLLYTGSGSSTNRRLGIGTGATAGKILSSGTGALQLTSTSSMGFNGVTGARTLTLGGTYVGDANVFGNAIGDNTGATSLVKSGAGTWALTGANTYTGTLSVDAGTLAVGNGGGSGSLGSGAVTVASGATLAFNRTGLLTVAAAIGGAGDIVKVANGEVAISGSNTLTGSIAVNAGKLAFINSASSGSASSVTVASGATVSLGDSLVGGTLTLNNLSGAGRVDAMWNATAGVRTLAVNSTADTTFSGTILNEDASTGRVIALAKTGSAKLTLSGTNTFTGGVALAAGTLEVASSSALGTGTLTASGGTLAGSATLANAVSLSSGLSVGNGTLTLNGVISESASGKSLQKSGTGTLTLGGVNTYTGSTEVLAGRLTLATGASVASSSLVIHDGAELETVDGLSLGAGKSLSLGSGNAIVAGTHVGNLTLSGGSISLDFGASTNDTLAVVGDLTLASGSLVFTKSGTYTGGTYTLLTYSGAYAPPASPADVTLSGLASDGTSRQTFNLTHDADLKALQLAVGGVAQDVKWTGAAGSSWTPGSAGSANWQVTSDPNVADADRYFNGDTVTFDDSATSGAVVIGASDLTPVSIAVTADTLDYSIGSDGGVINGGSLSKSGASTLTLSSGHTFAGGVTLSAGKIRVGADTALGTGTLTVNGGRLSVVGTTARALSNALQVGSDFALGAAADDTGELTLSGAVNLGGASRTLTVDSGVTLAGSLSNGFLVKSGSATLTVSGANTLGVATTVASGTLALGAAGAIADSAGISVADGATLDLGGFSEGLGTLALADGSALTNGTLTSGAVTVNGVATLGAALGGTVSLTKSGNGSLTLASPSTRSGSTTLAGGALLVGDAAALGSGSLALNGCVFALSDGTARTLSNALTVGGDVTLGAAGSGALTLAGNVGLLSGSRKLTLASDVRLSGVVSSGSLTKAGNGVLTLSGSNTYSGGTTLSSGKVVLTNASGLGSGVVTLNDAATSTSNTTLELDASGGSLTFARGLTVANQGTGVATIGSAAYADNSQKAVFSGAITLAKGVTLRGGAGGDRTDFSGGISGTGDVRVETGAGGRVILLTNANTFAGNLTVGSNSVLQLSDGTSTAASLIPDAAIVTLESGAQLRFAKGGNAATEVVAGFVGTGTVTAISGADKLEVSHADDRTMSVTLTQGAGTLALTKSGTGTLTFDGSYGLTTGLTVSAGTMVFANAVNLAATTTVRGKLVFQANSLLGDNLTNSSTNTDAEVDFGANTLTLGTSSNGTAYYGKLTGTGTIVLAGGSGSVANVTDGTTAGNVTTNRQVWVQTASGVIQDASVQFFALNTGVSLSNRRDFIFANETGEALNLSALSGYGSIRGDWGGTNGVQTIRRLVVDQDSDTVFNGALLSHRSTGSPNALRALSLTKRGSGTLELAGFIGKQTASAASGAAGVYLTVEDGVLLVTNPYNTTSSNTGAIDLADITVSGGTLGFAAQALVNTAGTAGATSIVLDGGTLRWNEGNAQDISLGGRLRLVSAKEARLDVGANSVTLSAALAGAADGSLVKLGSGSLTLSAANSFTGGVTLSAGTLVAGDAGAFGTGDILLSAGTLDFNNLDVMNRVIFAGGTLINVRSGGAVAIDETLTAAQINALDIPAIAAVSGTSLNLAGVTKDVIVTGAANLSGLSSFAGTLAVSGALDLSDAGNRPSGAALELRDGGSIDFGQSGFSGDITYKGGAVSGAFSGNLNVSGAVTLTAANIASGKVVVGSTHSVGLASGFAGTVRLEGGAVTSGLETFAGSLELGTGGSLNLTAEPSPLAAVVVDDGGVLRGTGTVASLTVNSGGLLAPGNSPGLTTVGGTLVLQGGGSLDMEVQATGADIFTPTAGTDYDSVLVLGDLDLTGLSVGNRFLINLISLADATTAGDVLDFNPEFSATFDVIAYQNLVNTYGGSITDLFQLDTTSFTYGGLPVDANLFSLIHNTVDQKIQLVYAPVPEPSTYGLMLGGLALAGAALRRRRQNSK